MMGATEPQQLIVDNSNGSDAGFAAALAEGLRADGFEVELRAPRPAAIYDTGVHFVAEGVGVRVPDGVDRLTLDRVAAVIRIAVRARPERKRYRAVPIYRRETSQALRWVDIFDGA